MKISRIIVPVVALTATMNNYNSQVRAISPTCIQTCNLGAMSCMEKCEMFGGFLPGGEALCFGGCAAVYAGCMALCAASS